MSMRPIFQGWLLVYATVILISLISSKCEGSEVYLVSKKTLRGVKPLEAYDADVAKYVDKFTKDFNRDVRHVVQVYPVVLPAEPLVVGICLPSFGQVRLLERVWNSYDETQKEILVYHELLHCEFGLEHIGAAENPYKTCPTSLMHPVTLPPSCYKSFKWIYILQSKSMIRAKRLNRAIRKHGF